MDLQSTSEPAWLPGGSARQSAAGAPVLVAGCCRSCGTRMFPKMAVCSSCMSEDMAEEDLPATGTLYSFTQVHVGPAQWLKPLTVGYVDLPNGVRVFSHLRPTPGLAIGATVSLTSGKVGVAADGAPLTTFMFQAEE